jgi:Transposase, Mutator family
MPTHRNAGQTCIVHLIRNSLDYASWKDRKPLAAALRPIYAAASADWGESGASLEGGDEPVRDPLSGALHPRGLRGFSVLRQQDSPSLTEQGVVLGAVKLWVLAMLASKRGLCVAPVPPQAANLTGPARDADAMAGRDEGTGGLIEPSQACLSGCCIHPLPV